jgi:hypothetical protein
MGGRADGRTGERDKIPPFFGPLIASSFPLFFSYIVTELRKRKRLDLLLVEQGLAVSP